MSAGKILLAVLLLLAALIGGLFFAGWLTPMLLHVQVPLAWDTWWQYVRVIDLPQIAPYADKIKMAGGIGFGAPLLAWLMLLIPLFKARAESLHGDASLANASDIGKDELFKQTPQGILIGNFRGRHLWLNGAQHVIMIAPTRSGKTTSVAVPVLHTYQQSMVVLDLKGELRKLTSGRRLAMGQSIYTWAPYDEQGCTDRFNPFTLLDGMNAGKRLGEIQTIAAILYPDEPGKDPFWTSQSRAAFTAFASYMFEAWDHHMQQCQHFCVPDVLLPKSNSAESFPSFERILRLSSGLDGQGTLAMLKQIIAAPKNYPYVSTQTRTVFGNLAGLAEQTFSSVIATMQAPLQQFLNPTLAAATNATDFDILSLRKQPTTLYIIIPTNKLDESGKLLNIFFSSVIGNNLGKQLGEEPSLKYQMLMLMDEFTAMGRVDVWSKRISISASYGVRDLCIVQSRAQLRSTYGDNDAQNFITNHGCQIVFTPREQSDANEYSEMMGYKTVRKENRSRSSGSGNSSVSISYNEERRALMLPQEIKELPNDDELIFKEGLKPLRAKKNWFFKDKQFIEWSNLPAVVVEPLAERLTAARDAKPATDNERVVHARTEQVAQMLAQ
ncbi:type IV secretory system conjugative DNA transfer family protein [Rhodanobacter sp. L36]|uniref:type IV secretory system conjugative DNA transfer family protein n=1 Tax=Rhodanobacter sp. L36 TaxID=1747221 RepID=UPI00131C0614|nr:type IV secretory system conjugative DNA transfer family protein [Rhodanobacter sp. L36]